MTRQSLHRPAALASVAAHPLLPQGWQDANEKIFAVDAILSVSSSMFDAFHSPTGSVSNVIELLPPSITSTPLSKAGPREGRMTSSDSRHSSASLFASSSFNLPSYPS